jgi:hypothetical protein
MKKYICNSCGVLFESKKGCKSRQPKFCGKQCYGKSLKLNISCLVCNKTIENPKGEKISNRKFCSRSCNAENRTNKKLPETWKNSLSLGRKKSMKCKGPNLYNWKGGKETERERIKQSFYKRKKNLTKDLPIKHLKNLIILQQNKCFYCENELINYKAIEHLTPIARGGDNDFYNLVYSCKSCNSKKRTKTLEEYVIFTKKYHLIDKFDSLIALSYEN